MKIAMLTSSYDRKLKEEGFIADWIDALAKKSDELVVILLNKPKIHNHPDNVHIYYLSKPGKVGKLLELWKILNIEHRAKKIDGVFTQIFEFLAVVGGLWGRLNRVKTAYWYAGGINFNTVSINSLAMHLNNKVLTCSNSEAERYTRTAKLSKKKVLSLGHAINTSHFNKVQRSNNRVFTIGYVCRCTPNKNIEVLVRALSLGNISIKYKLALSRIDENPEYYKFVKKEIEKATHINKNLKIEIITNVNYSNSPKFYSSLDLYVHPSLMKSIDKAGLEAIASQVPVLLSNRGYAEICDNRMDILFNPIDHVKLNQLIRQKVRQNKKKNLNYDYIIEKFSLDSFMKKVISIFL